MVKFNFDPLSLGKTIARVKKKKPEADPLENNPLKDFYNTVQPNTLPVDKRPATQNPSPLQPKTPLQTSKEGGQAFVKEREKLISKGLSQKDAARQAALNLEGQFTDTFDPRVQVEKESIAGQVGSLTADQRNRNIIKGEGAVDAVGQVSKGSAGAIAGAAIGTAIFPGVGTAIGGVLGAVGSSFAAISLDQRQDVKQSFAVAQKAQNNLAFVINEVNAGRMDSITAVQIYNEELANLYSAERNLKKFTSGKIGRELSGAMDERAKVEAMMIRVPYMNALLQNAILAPTMQDINIPLESQEEQNI